MRISDWSSDVCSSDLTGLRSTEQPSSRSNNRRGIRIEWPNGDDARASAPWVTRSALAWARLSSPGRYLCTLADVTTSACIPPAAQPVASVGTDGRASSETRSEERRVGEEGGSTCRYRWWPLH